MSLYIALIFYYYADQAPLAKWLRHPPPKRETAGSSPVWGFRQPFFYFFTINKQIVKRNLSALSFLKFLLLYTFL